LEKLDFLRSEHALKRIKKTHRLRLTSALKKEGHQEICSHPPAVPWLTTHHGRAAATFKKVSKDKSFPQRRLQPRERDSPASWAAVK
jgi:hypothetical protein